MLPPGKEIPFHTDGRDELWKSCHRVHLPVITEQEVVFFYEKEVQHLPKNTLTEINNFVRHGVRHNGQSNRYHIMYDLLSTNYSGEFIVTQHSSVELFNEHCAREKIERLSFR